MASLERFALAPDLTICRILNGIWQVSGAHGRIEREKALESMAAHIEAGLTTWHLALTNFDTERLAGILDQGIRVVSNQIQFSLIDRRPEVRMAPFCRERGVHLLAYGTVCGGLLSERYLNQPEPRGSALDTASLQ